jgi:hypothetical protein
MNPDDWEIPICRHLYDFANFFNLGMTCPATIDKFQLNSKCTITDIIFI